MKKKSPTAAKNSHPRLRAALKFMYAEIPSLIPSRKVLEILIWELMRTQTELKELKDKLCRLKKANPKK